MRRHTNAVKSQLDRSVWFVRTSVPCRASSSVSSRSPCSPSHSIVCRTQQGLIQLPAAARRPALEHQKRPRCAEGTPQRPPTARRHTTVRCRIPFYSALSCAACAPRQAGPRLRPVQVSCTGGAAPRETPAFYMIMSACGKWRMTPWTQIIPALEI